MTRASYYIRTCFLYSSCVTYMMMMMRMRFQWCYIIFCLLGINGAMSSTTTDAYDHRCRHGNPKSQEDSCHDDEENDFLDTVRCLYKNGSCKWPDCEEPCDDIYSFVRFKRIFSLVSVCNSNRVWLGFETSWLKINLSCICDRVSRVFTEGFYWIYWIEEKVTVSAKFFHGIRPTMINLTLWNRFWSS